MRQGGRPERPEGRRWAGCPALGLTPGASAAECPASPGDVSQRSPLRSLGSRGARQLGEPRGDGAGTQLGREPAAWAWAWPRCGGDVGSPRAAVLRVCPPPQELVKSFNRDRRIFCVLLSTRSRSGGLSLMEADAVVFYDHDLNPVLDAQAQHWCDRIGRRKDVHVYR